MRCGIAARQRLGRGWWRSSKRSPFSSVGRVLEPHLYGYLKERGIQQTRSRPYRKNDQAHVEQKNYTHVRQLLGYERLGERALLAPRNQLLELWSLWKNLYCTTMEQLSATREGSKQRRQHLKRPQTPAQRLLASGQLNESQRRRIEEHLERTNPFVMKVGIEKLLGQIWKKRSRLLRPWMGRRTLRFLTSLRYAPGGQKPQSNQPQPKKATVSSYEATGSWTEPVGCFSKLCPRRIRQRCGLVTSS